ncbi:VWA domain-containing protein [Rhodococcus aerolatus]
MADLPRGANAVLTEPTDRGLTLAVTGAQPGTVDLLVLQLTDAGVVRTDDDLVFYNQPRSPEGAVRLVGGDQVEVDLARVPADVTTLAVAVAAETPLADVAGLAVRVGGHECHAAGLTTERAAVLVEVYRRAGAWKVRNRSAGWAEGLPALVREHGVSVDDDENDDAPTEPVVRSVPGEERLAPAVREKLDLRKRAVATVLLTKGAPQVRARVVLVMDKTGSMRKQYNTGVVRRVVERVVPVAVQLDDDGALECLLYARGVAVLPDLHVAELSRWCDAHLHLAGVHAGIDHDAIGHSNDEIPVLTTILQQLQRGAELPTLVLFFTDGGFSQKAAITALIRRAAGLPAFFQFVGVGQANYGLLTRLDELDGREVDNVGFFALDDIDAVSDAELYDRLLGEFPDWLRAARAAGVLGGRA